MPLQMIREVCALLFSLMFAVHWRCFLPGVQRGRQRLSLCLTGPHPYGCETEQETRHTSAVKCHSTAFPSVWNSPAHICLQRFRKPFPLPSVAMSSNSLRRTLLKTSSLAAESRLLCAG